MTDTEVATLVALVRTNWPNFECTRDTVAAWDRWLGGHDYRTAEAAVVSLAYKRRDFAPTPAQVCNELVRITEHLPAPDDAVALVFPHLGAPAGATWHPLLDEAVSRFGGKRAIGLSDEVEGPRRFRRLYESMLDSHVVEVLTEQQALTGGSRPELNGPR